MAKLIKPLPTKNYADAILESGDIQMELFTIEVEEDSAYFGSVPDYDILPKYYWGKTPTRTDGVFLPSLVRNMRVHKSLEITVQIDPARIQGPDGIVRDYYPGEREEFVEIALRRLLLSGEGQFIEDTNEDNDNLREKILAGVVFSLYELQQELKRNGHAYSYPEIRHSLQILNKSNIEVRSELPEEVREKLEGKAIAATALQGKSFSSTFLPTLGIDDETGKIFVRFGKILTDAIRDLQLRRVHYFNLLQLKNPLARWLYLRISGRFIQAGLDHDSTHILLTTIIRESSIELAETSKATLRHQKWKCVAALQHLVDQGYLKSFEVEDRLKGKKIQDCYFQLNLSPKWIDEIIEGNRRSKKIRGIFNQKAAALS